MSESFPPTVLNIRSVGLITDEQHSWLGTVAYTAVLTASLMGGDHGTRHR